MNGVAAGGGLRAGDDVPTCGSAAHAASFTTAFAKRGLIAEHGTSWLLPRLVGTSRALDLLWSARRIDAEEAFRIGFLDRIVDGDVAAAAAEYVRRAGRGRVAVVDRDDEGAGVPRAGRRRSGPRSARWTDEVKSALDHPDATEGVASFVERRPPAFAPLERRSIDPAGTGGSA